MGKIKISELTPKDAPLSTTDLLIIAEETSDGYESKSVTGRDIQKSVGKFGNQFGINTDTPTHSLQVESDEQCIILAKTSNTTGGGVALMDGNTTNEFQVGVGAFADRLCLRSNAELFKFPTTDGTSGQAMVTDGSGNLSFASKQATLVSGTNIKTINGTSLLGSGDLTIGGGGGLQGVHALTAIPTGFNYGYSASLTALNATASYNTGTSALILSPFIPARDITYTSLKINVTTATASCLTRILIYSDNNGLPSTKLFESSSLDCSTTGNKTITITGTFTAGTTYWIGTHANNNCVLSGIPVGSALSVGIFVMTAGHITGWSYAYVFNSAPSTLNQAQRTNLIGSIPLIQILP